MNLIKIQTDFFLFLEVVGPLLQILIPENLSMHFKVITASIHICQLFYAFT